MLYLGDYLSTIIYEIAAARLKADLETIKLADYYATHPYLKHMSVPHFRIPTITLDIAVTAQGTEKIEKNQSVGTLNSGCQIKNIREIIDPILHAAEVTLNDEELQTFDSKVGLKAAVLSLQSKYASAVRTSEILSNEIMSLLMQSKGFLSIRTEIKREQLAEDIRNTLQRYLMENAPPCDRLKVEVTASELNKIGNKDLLTILHLEITEDSLEWVTEEVLGERKHRLIQE
ncbi:hypothetical protein JW979_14005 [bacterium]|nr:hypothetical protein [candidate division CSSED10-310 bacterium]